MAKQYFFRLSFRNRLLLMLFVVFLSSAYLSVGLKTQALASEHRTVVMDAQKAEQLTDMQVRAVQLDSEKWGDMTIYVPIPNAFVDIETFTEDTLPDWLDEDVRNLNGDRVILAKKADSTAYPEFSKIWITFYSFDSVQADSPEDSLDSVQADSPDSQGDDNIPSCNEELAYVTGASDIFPMDRWETGLLELSKSSVPEIQVCFSEDENGGIGVLFKSCSGHVDTELRDRVLSERAAIADKLKEEHKEEILKLMEEEARAAKREGREPEMENYSDFADRYVEEYMFYQDIPIGESFNTRHKAAVILQVFQTKKVLVSVHGIFGPASSPEVLRQAHTVVTAWKAAFLAVNQ